MKQLLYIPGGSFINIVIEDDLLSLEEYINIRNNSLISRPGVYGGVKEITENTVIDKIIDYSFTTKFYHRNELPGAGLTREMFEVVDV